MKSVYHSLAIWAVLITVAVAANSSCGEEPCRTPPCDGTGDKFYPDSGVTEDTGDDTTDQLPTDLTGQYCDVDNVQDVCMYVAGRVDGKLFHLDCTKSDSLPTIQNFEGYFVGVCESEAEPAYNMNSGIAISSLVLMEGGDCDQSLNPDDPASLQADTIVPWCRVLYQYRSKDSEVEGAYASTFTIDVSTWDQSVLQGSFSGSGGADFRDGVLFESWEVVGNFFIPDVHEFDQRNLKGSVEK